VSIVKICGATSDRDVELLAASGADLVGMWHGVPGGHAELSMQQLSAVATAAHRTDRVKPVLVTFLHDADTVLRVVRRTGVRWVQLHGYQRPSMVRALKAAPLLDLTVVKVLHVKDGHCVERSFIGAYERAGTDCFLLDTATDDGRVGSTGQSLPAAAVAELADLVSRPFLLAGGISADNRDDYDTVLEHPRFLGIDVDTAARDDDGSFHAGRIRALRRRWWARTGVTDELDEQEEAIA
jgi:phosphoribosylanthranilate isomerase